MSLHHIRIQYTVVCFHDIVLQNWINLLTIYQSLYNNPTVFLKMNKLKRSSPYSHSTSVPVVSSCVQMEQLCTVYRNSCAHIHANGTFSHCGFHYTDSLMLKYLTDLCKLFYRNITVFLPGRNDFRPKVANNYFLKERYTTLTKPWFVQAKVTFYATYVLYQLN